MFPVRLGKQLRLQENADQLPLWRLVEPHLGHRVNPGMNLIQETRRGSWAGLPQHLRGRKTGFSITIKLLPDFVKISLCPKVDTSVYFSHYVKPPWEQQ